MRRGLELLRQAGVLVDVDLDHLDAPGVLLGEVLEHRAHDAAGPAPRCPQVDQDGHRRARLVGEGGIGRVHQPGQRLRRRRRSGAHPRSAGRILFFLPHSAQVSIDTGPAEAAPPEVGLSSRPCASSAIPQPSSTSVAATQLVAGHAPGRERSRAHDDDGAGRPRPARRRRRPSGGSSPASSRATASVAWRIENMPRARAAGPASMPSHSST